jgi:hypothetical protein
MQAAPKLIIANGLNMQAKDMQFENLTKEETS